jgi:hypothetical protein
MSKMERKGSNKSRSRVPDAAKLKGKLRSNNDKTEPGKKNTTIRATDWPFMRLSPPPPPLLRLNRLQRGTNCLQNSNCLLKILMRFAADPHTRLFFREREREIVALSLARLRAEIFLHGEMVEVRSSGRPLCQKSFVSFVIGRFVEKRGEIPTRR